RDNLESPMHVFELREESQSTRRKPTQTRGEHANSMQGGPGNSTTHCAIVPPRNSKHVIKIQCDIDEKVKVKRDRIYGQRRYDRSMEIFSAQQACMTCFEDLAVINSAELTQAIPSPSYATWIGLSRSSAGDFVWVVDNQTVYGNWAAGEPTNDNCVYLQTNKMWNSYPCSNGLCYTLFI
uniref:C-type lectin domain-containing protein n=1 Tax=Erpetoichthys calabaricus TaxID=27687 RepID=A0A8C4RVN3_ERPCA